MFKTENYLFKEKIKKSLKSFLNEMKLVVSMLDRLIWILCQVKRVTQVLILMEIIIMILVTQRIFFGIRQAYL